MMRNDVIALTARSAHRAMLVAGLAAGLAFTGCAADSGTPEPEAQPEPEVQPEAQPEPEAQVGVVEKAASLYPRFIDVQQYIVGKSCAPNLGVCHNTFNYPDMHSVQNTLGLIAARCNVELPDPLAGWDSCEVDGDILYAGDFFASEIAYVDKTSDSTWTIGLKEPPTETATYRPQIYSPDNDIVLEPFQDWNVEVNLVLGAHEAELRVLSPDGFIVNFVEGAMGAVNAGDPNRNGVFGASDDSVMSGALIVPGNLERSYLWGRITKTVPGTQMPLANEPLKPEMFVAVACWIESMDDSSGMGGDNVVDYENCAFAQNPIDYTANPGGPDADG